MRTVGASIRVRQSGSSLTLLGGVGDLPQLLRPDTPFTSKEQLIVAAQQLGWEFEAEMRVGETDLEELILLFGREEDGNSAS